MGAALDETTLLFAYGTLMTGFGNNRVLAGAQSLGRAHTRDAAFEMFHAGVPFVRAAASRGVRIAGELFAVTSAAVLAAVDALEGHPDWYVRTAVAVTLDEAPGTAHRAVIYLNPRVGDRAGDGVVIDDAAPVASGDFRDVAAPAVAMAAAAGAAAAHVS
jgi:gamma-glutamylcyclotransferase (GGCT)/AIG2-like uncharacterized protein YtfP